MPFWDVYLNHKKIDSLSDESNDASDVKRSLVNHDGYDPGIVVRKQPGQGRYKKPQRRLPVGHEIGLSPGPGDDTMQVYVYGPRGSNQRLAETTLPYHSTAAEREVVARRLSREFVKDNMARVRKELAELKAMLRK
jgi:hypothetical protein